MVSDMTRKFLRTFVVVVAALTAMCLPLGQDEFRESDGAFVQIEMLKESADNLNAHRNHQVVYFLQVSPYQHLCSPSSTPTMPPPALSALSTCILRC